MAFFHPTVHQSSSMVFQEHYSLLLQFYDGTKSAEGDKMFIYECLEALSRLNSVCI